MPVEAGLDWLEVAWLGLLRALTSGNTCICDGEIVSAFVACVLANCSSADYDYSRASFLENCGQSIDFPDLSQNSTSTSSPTVTPSSTQSIPTSSPTAPPSSHYSTPTSSLSPASLATPSSDPSNLGPFSPGAKA